MSGTITPTVAATPTSAQFTQDMLAVIAAESGAATDYNVGSQIRTLAESIGSVVATEGIGAQALALQTIVYSALSLFNITPSGPVPASGALTFATAFPSGPPSTLAVAIPAGTLVQTSGGILFATTAATTLVSGATGIVVGAQATIGGVAGNVPALAINGFPVTSLGYPLSVQNQTPMTGGANGGSVSNALAQFTAEVDRLGLASPVAVANAAIGQAVGSEVVQYSACYEPWLAAVNAGVTGAASATAGFTLYIDNGTGAASNALVTQVSSWITGSGTGQSGYRPAGMPFTVSAVSPIFLTVGVTGTTIPGIVSPTVVQNSATSGVEAYFATLGFSGAAYQPQIAAAVSDAGLGYWQSLTVSLFASGTSTPVSAVFCTGAGQRILLGALQVSITAGT